MYMYMKRYVYESRLHGFVYPSICQGTNWDTDCEDSKGFNHGGIITQIDAISVQKYISLTISTTAKDQIWTQRIWQKSVNKILVSRTGPVIQATIGDLKRALIWVLTGRIWWYTYIGWTLVYSVQTSFTILISNASHCHYMIRLEIWTHRPQSVACTSCSLHHLDTVVWQGSFTYLYYKAGGIVQVT